MTHPQPPFFAFWADRWLAATHGWTAEEKGIYFALLIHQFTSGSVPNDVDRMTRIAGCTPEAFQRAWEAVVRHKFQVQDDGTLANSRMAEERAKAANLSRRRSENGRKGGAARHKKNLAKAQAKVEPGHNNPDPDPELSTTRRKKRARFEPETVTDDPVLIAAALAWQRYRAEAGLKPWTPTTWRKRLTEAQDNPKLFAESVEHSISQGYQGVFPPNQSKPKGSALPKGLQTLKDWHDNSDF